MNETKTRMQQELVAIIKVITEITGLSSRWSGEVELSQDIRVLGRKPFSCHIVINESLVNHPARWRTLIHEALHSFSAGYNMADYQAFLGWEEGVVEQTQRLLRPAVLERLGIELDPIVFELIEVDYSFNKYIRAIEEIRYALHRVSETDFYLGLIATEIKQRHNYVFGIGNRLSSKDRIAFISIFSRSNSVLKEAP